MTPARKGQVALLVLLSASAIANLLIGSISIPIDEFFGGIITENDFSDIIWQFRFPKMITCLLAGSALAASGLLMQTFFRNPLAGPDVLGLSSGAGLMVALVLLGGRFLTSTSLLSNPWIIAIAASAGAALVLLLVLIISGYVRENASLLIIGLMIGAGTSSIVAVLQFVSRAEDLQSFMIWSLGNVGGTGWDEINVLSLVVIAGTMATFSQIKSLDSWLLGENYAKSLGINIRRSRFLIVMATSVMAGGVTAFCGPIAFVGLAVPHLVRMVIHTTNHKILIPSVMMGGAALLLLCDILAQLPGRTQILPLNAVTSLIGAPVVIWVVMRSRKIRI